ncbi:ATP-binding protein [Lachnoclostridium sp. Marseille-P6806]|uniref:ATP-binding protein n=1 Tax=Lachnoclostridium sp. Marseille-P6806 TaxID=2364793 RepID=UPI0010309289|nr:ATP-binding protein [Lachnoclostridium sp. Marseille-P6806]
MTREELLEKLKMIQVSKCETQTLELKAAEFGCPKRLYDTLSSFSNQDDGGVIIFGVDEKNGFNECGVYDSQDIQKKINEQCIQMEPPVRPLLTVAEKDGKLFVSAEIPGIDLSERPCYYRGRGWLKGSYVRVGDSDEPMTEYEVYSYEAFRKKYQDDIRPVPRASYAVLDKALLDDYMDCLKAEKPNLSSLPDETIRELMSITRNGDVTLSSVLLFCRYPQAFFPQLCITAVVLPGDEPGEFGDFGERFIDNQRIEGNISDMLDRAIAFVRRNMRTKTIINPETGKREDRTDYPITAVREAILNTLVHRDYSIHTEGMPIQILMYSDRIEIKNPGGLYGRIQIDQLGKMQPDTRNPVLVTALELMNLTENRYSGIPTIRRAMKEAGLKEPVFADERGTFTVTLYNNVQDEEQKQAAQRGLKDKEEELLMFLKMPRSRQEIAEHLGIGTVAYVMRAYVNPMIEKGLVQMTMPETPKSPKQRFVKSTP